MSVYPVTYYCLPITATPVRGVDDQRKYLDYQFVDNKQPHTNKGTIGEDYYCEADKECQREGGDYRFITSYLSDSEQKVVSDVPPPPTTVFSPMVTVMTAVTVWIKDQIWSVSTLLLVY